MIINARILLLIAAIVMFFFALIAALSASGLFLGVVTMAWIASGLLSWAIAFLVWGVPTAKSVGS